MGGYRLADEADRPLVRFEFAQVEAVDQRLVPFFAMGEFGALPPKADRERPWVGVAVASGSSERMTDVCPGSSR